MDLILPLKREFFDYIETRVQEVIAENANLKVENTELKNGFIRITEVLDAWKKAKEPS